MIRSGVDTGATAKALQGVAKQLAFASSRTVNGLALKAQAKVREKTGERFTLRRPDFIKGSVRGGARHQERPPGQREHSAAASVRYSRGDDLAGTRRDRTSRGRRAPGRSRSRPGRLRAPSPAEQVAGEAPPIVRRHHGRGRDVHPPAHRPEGTEAEESEDRNLGAGCGSEASLKVMYKLRDEVPVRPRLGFEETCREVARTETGPLFAKELANAIRTGRSL
jgi:hypothetical protein